MPSVAVIGTRGYPSYYGGFETAIRRLAPFLVDKGWDVTVYGRHGATKPCDADINAHVTTRVTGGLDTKNMGALSYGLTSSVDAAIRQPDVALVMNIANGYFLPLLKARGVPTLVNVDGIEWERAKWSALARSVIRLSATCTARWADELVFDSLEVEDHWLRTFGVQGKYIPYGGDVQPVLAVPDGLTHRGYVLIVARFVPENTVPQIFEAIPTIAANCPVVIVGTSGYGRKWDDKAQTLADDCPSVSWLGHVSNDELLLALWQHAGVYFHGHSVGGTNPALVQAMAAGAPIVARDTVFNREVLGPRGTFVNDEPDVIAKTILEMLRFDGELDEVCRANVNRVENYYQWNAVCQDYELALRALLPS